MEKIKREDMRILPGLTTISNKRPAGGNHWREKVREIDELGLEEIALFPTCLSEIKERDELYNLLSETGIKKIPHVHLRDDMMEWELDLLKSDFHTEVFNTHPWPSAIAFLEKTKYAKDIYIENLNFIDDVYMRALESAGGICVDFSHYEDWGIINCMQGYERFPEILSDHKIGCCHISAILDRPQKKDHEGREYVYFNSHLLQKESNLDYMEKHLPLLPEIASIELENSLKEQVEAIKYLKKMIGRHAAAKDAVSAGSPVGKEAI